MWFPAIYAADPIDVPKRPSERPLEAPDFQQKQPPKAFTLPPVPEPSPGVSTGGPDLQVNSVAFEGNRAIATEDLLAIAKPFVGRQLSAAEIEELRHQITRHYISKGYISSGAVLSEDAYRDGKLTFHIVEGKLDEIRLVGQERLRESYIRDRLRRGDEPLNINALQERFQMLLTDPLFSKMNARLLPGEKPGQAILDVEVTRALPYQLTLFTNNYRPPSIGSEAYGVSGWVRNLTGFGDVLDATYQGGRSDKNHSLDWSVPLTSYGTTFQVRHEQGDSTLIEEPFKSIDIKSTFKSLEFGVTQPLIDRLRQRFALGLTHSNRESTTTLLGMPFSFTPGEPDGLTKLNVWRFSQDYLQRGDENVFVARSTFSRGHNNIEQDQLLDIAPDRDYSVWLGQFQYAHRVMDNNSTVLLRGFIQTTGDRLVPLERISIGGHATVRGYRENQIVRDVGYAGSLEFHYPLLGAKTVDHALELVTFYDFGAAHNQRESTDRLSSVGLGFSGHYKGLSGDLYYGHRLKRLPGDSSSNLQDKGIHFQIRYDIF